MRQLIVVGLASIALGVAVASSAHGEARSAAAQLMARAESFGHPLRLGVTPTPQGSETISPGRGTPAPSTTPSTLEFRWDDRDSFRWRTLPTAAAYELTGTVYAIRANASSPFCSAPLSADSQNITLNETLDGTVTSFRVLLPNLPPEDIWFVPSAMADLRAIDANGTTIASEHVGFLFETFCATPSTPVPSVRAPDAGAGDSSSASGGYLVAALVACGLAFFAAGLRRSRLRLRSRL